MADVAFPSIVKLVNEHEAAEILGLSVKTLRRWRWAGGGPRFIKCGAAVRYDPADLATYIDAGRRANTSERPTALR